MKHLNSHQLRARRKRLGLDQADLSLLIGLHSAKAVSRFECGERDLSARALTGYLILFDTTYEDLLPQQAYAQRLLMHSRAKALLTAVKQEASRHTKHKEKQLEALVTRLYEPTS